MGENRSRHLRELDEYEKETLFRIFIIALAVFVVWSGSEAESFSELAPCLIWGTIGVLVLLTIYFAMQSRRERKGEVLGE